MNGLRGWTSTIIRALQTTFRTYGYRLNRSVTTDGATTMQAPLGLGPYTAATLPDATLHEGAVIYVSDGSAGAKFRGSDGTTWVNLG